MKCTLQVEQQAVNGKVLLPGYNEEGLLTLNKCVQGLLTLTGCLQGETVFTIGE